MRTSENSQKLQKATQPIKLKEKSIPAIPQESPDANKSSRVEEHEGITGDEDLKEVQGKVQESTDMYSTATDIEPSEVIIVIHFVYCRQYLFFIQLIAFCYASRVGFSMII